MKPKNALVVCYKNNFGTDSVVKKALQKFSIQYKCIDRDDLSLSGLKGHDLIITVGGDGTFLRTAQHVTNQLVLSVASNLRFNEGFYSRASKSDFEKKLRRIVYGKFKILELNRLHSSISYKGKVQSVEPALNEIFIGNSKPYLTTRYTLVIGRKSEFQKSSGILVATGAGSTAWAGSAGGRKLSFSSKKSIFVVREPYKGRLCRPKLTKGILAPGATLKIISHDWAGIVAVDSHHHEHTFKEGAVITVTNSALPLRFVDF